MSLFDFLRKKKSVQAPASSSVSKSANSNEASRDHQSSAPMQRTPTAAREDKRTTQASAAGVQLQQLEAQLTVPAASTRQSAVDPQPAAPSLGHLLVSAMQEKAMKARKKGDKRAELESLLALAGLYVYGAPQFRNPGEAVKCCERAFELLPQMGTSFTFNGLDARQYAVNLTTLAYADLAEQQHQAGRTQDALQTARRLLAFSERVRVKSAAAQAHICVAACYTHLQEFKTARQHWERALALTRSLRERESEGVVLFQLAGVCQKTYDFDHAAEFFRQSFVIFRELGDVKRASDAAGALVLALMYQARWSEARFYAEFALSVWQRTGDVARVDAMRHCLKMIEGESFFVEP